MSTTSTTTPAPRTTYAVHGLVEADLLSDPAHVVVSVRVARATLEADPDGPTTCPWQAVDLDPEWAVATTTLPGRVADHPVHQLWDAVGALLDQALAGMLEPGWTWGDLDETDADPDGEWAAFGAALVGDEAGQVRP